ncbi:MAG: sulfatase-like hydrolase/transferase, partial [Planctomycetota bacterium]
PHGPFIVDEKYSSLYTDKCKSPSDKFFGMITNIDENMGLLMQKLEEWELSERTLLIFMTDNGSARGTFNFGMRGKKGSEHEGGARVPLFMRLPGVTKPGVDIDRLTRHYDLFPTLASIAGAELPKDYELDGRSLVPLLQDAGSPWEDRDVFFHVGRWGKKGAGKWERGKTDPDEAKYNRFAVRNERWRLVGEELFDIDADPGEANDVSQQHPQIVKAMLRSYDQWWSEVRPMMVNEDASLDVRKPFVELYEKQKKESGIPNWVQPDLE